MHAASYVGRVGGLAVALGVGTAIFTGAGVAHATEGDDSGAPAGQEQGGGTTTPTQNTGGTGDPGKIDFKLPKLSDFIGRHRADDSTPNSNTANSIVKRLSDAAKRVTDAIESAAGAPNTVVRSTTTNTGDSSLRNRLEAKTQDTDAPASTPQDLTESSPAGTNNVVSNQFSNRAAAVKKWITSPLAVAGRSVDTTPTISPPTQLWTPPQILAPLGTMRATPGTGAVRATSLLTTVLGGLNPFAGNTPGSPVAVDPLSLVLAGAARREIGVESFTPTALLASDTNSLTYDPNITLVRGVITGCNGLTCGTTKDGVNYLVVSQPSGGGKVYVDPTTGDFTYLPDLASVQQPDATETFKVVAAEDTIFTQAIAGVPIIGGLADQILVVLYQIPVVNVVLSPIIGRSEITSVSVKVSDFPERGAAPIAFTTKIPSPKDGTLISINYFPAYQVAADTTGHTTAPTILNGPGLATAGNIDPNAPSIVDGLVPGLNYLRDPAKGAGYNVVTWDPRGEFDSGGTLQLDSPEYEGVDVTGIINFLSAGVNQPLVKQKFDIEPGDNNDPYVPGDATDPAIGMVGGSYGGGIQLSTASIDKRVDVIVPGIAWNSLDDALYPNEAFKTSYASLLLLGLVTSGSRINPQIYLGIITGDVLGVLFPSERALLLRSSPGAPPPVGYIDKIDAPALFIQGTVDVLFPLDQALANAAGIGTDPADVKMIWYCGGHGVCLTMNQDQLNDQETRLRNNTFEFLGAYLKDGDLDDTAKFQYVDQLSEWHTANLLPLADSDFYKDSTPITAFQADGGTLGIVPILGGTGPQSAAGFPASLGLGTPAKNAVTVPITYVPPNDEADVAYVVGSPRLTFDYTGVGTTRHVYAQIVDKKTGLVVGNIVTPVEVTLDGTRQTADVDMENIAWTYTDDTGIDGHPSNYDDLELQIVSSATAFEDFTSFGVINISNVNVSLPVAGPDVVDAPLPVPAPVGV